MTKRRTILASRSRSILFRSLSARLASASSSSDRVISSSSSTSVSSLTIRPAVTLCAIDGLRSFNVCLRGNGAGGRGATCQLVGMRPIRKA